MKYHYPQSRFTYQVGVGLAAVTGGLDSGTNSRRTGGELPPGTLLGGEFGWGGTSSTRQRRCPKISSVRTEISRSAKG